MIFPVPLVGRYTMLHSDEFMSTIQLKKDQMIFFNNWYSSPPRPLVFQRRVPWCGELSWICEW